MGWDSSDYDADKYEVGLAKWTKNKKTVLCPWVNKESPGERYDFDVSKADKIFKLLL